MHKQVWIKVNTQVDKGVAGIVKSLNRINGLFTLSSCEGYGILNGRRGGGHVYFRYGKWNKLCKFVFGTLAPKLIEKFGEEIDLQVTVTNDNDPIGEINFLTEIIPELDTLLKKLINTYCKSERSYGKVYNISHN